MSENKKILTGDAIHDDEGAVSDPECGGDFAGEVHVAGRVDQVNQETGGRLLLLLDEGHVLLGHVEEHRDGAER